MNNDKLTCRPDCTERAWGILFIPGGERFSVLGRMGLSFYAEDRWTPTDDPSHRWTKAVKQDNGLIVVNKY